MTGARNPVGKLAHSWPRSVGEIGGASSPWFALTQGQGIGSGFTQWWPYVFQPSTPLFPFGYGLQYTEYRYYNLVIYPTTFTENDNFSLSVTVENIGDVDGSELVLVYFNVTVSSIVRYYAQLLDFQKVFIPAKQKVEVNFEWPAVSLGFYNATMNYVLEPGQYILNVGGNAMAGGNVQGLCQPIYVV